MRWSFILLERLASFASSEQLRRRLALLRHCGYDGVELNLTEPFGPDEGRLRRWLEDEGLAVPSFLTGEAYSEGLCLSAVDAEVRKRTVARLQRYVAVAQRFRAKLVVGLLQGTRRDEPDPAVAHARIVDGLSRVTETARAHGVDVVLEPVNHLQVGFHNSVGEVLALCREIGSPALHPMVDTIHLNIEEASLTAPILACGSALRHVHLCESNGGPFGSGHIDFAAALHALRQIEYSGYASVKVYRNATFEQAARDSLQFLLALPAAGQGADPKT